MQKNQPKIVYKHIAFQMKMATTQVPYIIYDCIDMGEDYKEVRYQCLVGNGAFTIFKTKEEVLEAYPHVRF